MAQTAGHTEFSLMVGMCIVTAILAPLCVFAPPMLAAKRRSRREYGLLAAQYMHAFDRKWIHGERRADEPTLGRPTYNTWPTYPQAIRWFKKRAWCHSAPSI